MAACSNQRQPATATLDSTPLSSIKPICSCTAAPIWHMHPCTNTHLFLACKLHVPRMLTHATATSH